MLALSRLGDRNFGAENRSKIGIMEYERENILTGVYIACRIYALPEVRLCLAVPLCKSF
jgi:hypothetical protein